MNPNRRISSYNYGLIKNSEKDYVLDSQDIGIDPAPVQSERLMRRGGQLCFGSLVLAAALTKRRNFSDFSTTNIEVGDTLWGDLSHVA